LFDFRSDRLALLPRIRYLSASTQGLTERAGREFHRFLRFAPLLQVLAMTHEAESPRQSPHDPTGAFGRNLAAHFHLKESEQVSVAWAEDGVFGITRLQSDTGIPDRTTHVTSEAALHISVSILPVPLGTYDLWIDGKAIDVPFIPLLRTSVMDLQSDPVCWVGAGFDYVN